jgi:hypothetical protein
MLGRRRKADLNDDDPNVIVDHGPSLAKGPALLVGSILVAFGLAGLLENANFPDFSSAFPDGTANGSNFLGFEVNGWTCFLSIAAGALLLFGAAQHHLAKMMSLIVGAALAAAAVIAIIDGEDVLGLAAANFWTKLGLAVAGGAMLLNALMPRTKRRRHIDELRGTSAGYDRDLDRTDRDDAMIVDREDDRGERFGRPVETTSRFGRPAADQDLAATDADRIAPTDRDRSGAVSADDDVTPPRR